MFDDFRPNSSPQDRKRMGGSVLVATVLYSVVGALIVGGTTAATTNVVETLTQVEFAPPPPPPPPPPPQATVQAPESVRPKVKRKELKPPTEVPKEKPKESNADLAPSEDKGPVDGFLNGLEGGTGTGVAKAAAVAVVAPPPPKPEPTTAAVASKSNAQPGYSASAKRKEIEGVVVVGFDVLENGSVVNPQIISGPEELRESVLKTVVTWHFEPAKRGGKPYRTHLQRSIRFRLEDA